GGAPKRHGRPPDGGRPGRGDRVGARPHLGRRPLPGTPPEAAEECSPALPGLQSERPPAGGRVPLMLPFLGTVSPVPVVRLALVREGGASYVGEPIRSPADAAALLSPHLQDANREVVLALLLDIRHRPVGLHVVSIGS